jgi:hypothetical protein
MSIVSNHFPEVLDGLPDLPSSWPQPSREAQSRHPETAVRPRPRKPRSKPVRTFRDTLPTTTDNPMLGVTITQDGEAADYLILPIPSDWGEAFLVEKVFPERKTYHVNINGKKSTCECDGFLRWGHCRHIEVIPALRAKGKRGVE